MTFYLYRYGENTQISLESVSKHIGFNDTASLKMRIKNFQAIDGQGGLENYARLTRQVYNEYLNVDRNEHRQECIQIMNFA